MQFIIEDKVFETLPEICFGAVVARGLDNSGSREEIQVLLEEAIKITREKFKSVKLKEHRDLKPYRDSFIKMGINPNKFPSSVEALTTRIVKGGNLPDINPAVNLVNALSLKYSLPMGAHDLDAVNSDIEVRFSRNGDLFIPFGQTDPEIPGDGELIYASGNQVKTRKWIWRQSDRGKVTGNSINVFFPIDGFSDFNREKVIAARSELAAAVGGILNAKTDMLFLDKNNRSELI